MIVVFRALQQFIKQILISFYCQCSLPLIGQDPECVDEIQYTLQKNCRWNNGKHKSCVGLNYFLIIYV